MLSDCIIYKGFLDEKGYGRIDGRQSYFSHRLAYHLANGVSPRGKLVCHRCDNPSCINPDHLYLGTYQDNANDKVERDRCAKLSGENNPTSSITDAYAQLILEDQGTSREICTKFGVTYNTVYNIKSGRKWQHLNRSKAAPFITKKKLTKEQSEEIRIDPRPVVEIAKSYTLGALAVRNIKNRKSFKDYP